MAPTAPTAPVPSKNALRALCNIALGTSCTVAFGAGLLTAEDRRKRIQLATKIRDNGRDIKSVKGFHTAATAVLDDIDNGGLLKVRLGSDTARKLQQEAQTQEEPERPQPKSRAKRRLAMKELRAPHRQVVWLAPVWPSLAQHKTVPSLEPRTISPDIRSTRLAFDIVRLIGDGKDAARIDAATLRLLEASAEDPPMLNLRLKDAAGKLAMACSRHLKHVSMQKVLETTLCRGRLTTEEFERFQPELVISWLLEPKSELSDDESVSEEERLKQAVTVFLTRFDSPTERSKSTQLHAVGQQLCERTCALKLFYLTERVYWRLNSMGGVSSKSVHHLIVAASRLKKNNDVVRYFRKFYNYAGSRSDLIDVVEMVLDCTANLGDMKVATMVYAKAARLARNAKHTVPSSWLLKVLGHHWRSNKDIVETRKIFDGLEQYIPYTSVPEAAYAAIIQFCIEADQEDVAETYLAKFQENFSRRGLGIRICGHLALAKAKRGDWMGVHVAFGKVPKTCMYSTKQKADYGAVFLPLLKLYAESHSLSETEAFLRVFVDQYGMPITYYMSTFMVDLYGRNKEIEALTRWVRYVLSISPHLIDAEIFNIMLKNCRSQWHCSFQQLLQLLWAVKKLGGVRALGLTNDATYDTLLRVAIRDAKGNPDKLARSVNYELFNRPRQYLSDSRSLQLTMSEAISRGQSNLALNILARAESKKDVIISGEILITAVKASLRVHGHDLGPTIELLSRSQDKVTQELALEQILCQQLVRKDHERWGMNKAHDNMVFERVNQTIQKLQHTGYEIPVAVFSKLADALNHSGAYRQALELWKVLAGERHALMFRSSGHNICFNAYMGLKDAAGLQWVCAMLVKYDVVPQEYWYRRLRSAIHNAYERPDLQDFVKAACQTIEVVQDQRYAGATGRKNVSNSTFKVMQEATSAHRDMRGFAQFPSQEYRFNEAGLKGLNLDPVRTIKQSMKEKRGEITRSLTARDESNLVAYCI